MLFLLPVSLCRAQPKEWLEIRIDSVSVDDSQAAGRDFRIHFRIRNIADTNVSFFLETNQVMPNGSSSLSNKPFYRIWQGETLMDVSGIFDSWTRNNPPADLIMIDTIASRGEPWSRDDYDAYRRKSIRESRQRLASGESIDLTTTLRWDRERYIQHDEFEYYLDEQMPHYIEIGVNLLREEHRDHFTEAEFAELMAEPHFIRGWYISEKVFLDFGK